MHSFPSPATWLHFLLIWFGLKSPNKYMIHYALISKFKSQRTILSFSWPKSATFREQTPLNLSLTTLQWPAHVSGPWTHRVPFFFQAFALAGPSTWNDFPQRLSYRAYS